MAGTGPKSAASQPGLNAFRDIDQGALDAIPTGFCVCRADSGLVRYNRRATELWGRTPPLGDPQEQYGPAFRRYGAGGESLRFASVRRQSPPRCGPAKA
jgi:PAS domain-containing protein